MKPYHNPESGIEAFDYGDDWIQVRFKGGKVYEYRSPAVSSQHIATMKQLAESQDDLNTYISRHRNDVYSKGVKLG